MVPTTRIKEAAHAGDGYQPRPWISTARHSLPGLASGAQTLQRSFPTLGDLANQTLDSSHSAQRHIEACVGNADQEIGVGAIEVFPVCLTPSACRLLRSQS